MLNLLDFAQRTGMMVAVGMLANRVRHVVQSVFGGRRIVIFSGGPREDDEQVFEGVRATGDGGGFGSIIGRNALQHPGDEALRLLRTIVDIYWGTVS